MHVTRTLSYETPDNPPVRGYLVINLEKIFECGVGSHKRKMLKRIIGNAESAAGRGKGSFSS